MKKINFLLATVLVASIAFLNSCTKDTTPPTINFKGGSGYTSADVNVAAGTALKIGINAQSGSAKLASFNIVATYNSTPVTIFDTTFSSDTFNRDFELAVIDLGATALTFTVTDKDGETASVSLTVTTTEDISAYSEVLLGSYANPTLGSSFASADGTVYLLAAAKTNSNKIDWLYYYGASLHATIAAPDDATAATVFNHATNGLAQWTTKNATRFRLVTEGAVWDNVNTGADIAAIATGTTETDINDLAIGNILAFKTAAGKYGLIKITDLTAGNDGSIKYDVKVQK